MNRVILWILGLILVLLLLGVIGNSLGWFDGGQTPQAPAPQTSEPSPTPTPSDPSDDGGAEQLPDEPLPTTPANPVPSDQVPVTPPAPVDFPHNAAGALHPGSGSGYLDRTVWSPDMCFPFEEAAFANSQVYGPGGYKGPPGTGQCDSPAYVLPWTDNFCESRGYTTPLCANGKGHQGQDIRPATCKKAIHWVVAAEGGTITDIGSYTVTLTASAAPHRVYRYLHLQMDQLSVHEGSVVVKGGRLGKSSNNFGGTATTIHTHFEIRAGVAGLSTDGKPVAVHTFLPPYLSLVEAYRRKLNGGTCG
ncbi:MAG: family peptidase [Caulobacter sp.]|nr:family peptidase [Caulobacter sp.]